MVALKAFWNPMLPPESRRICAERGHCDHLAAERPLGAGRHPAHPHQERGGAPGTLAAGCAVALPFALGYGGAGVRVGVMGGGRKLGVRVGLLGGFGRAWDRYSMMLVSGLFLDTPKQVTLEGPFYTQKQRTD